MSIDSWDDLRIALAVARAGTVSAAAGVASTASSAPPRPTSVAVVSWSATWVAAVCAPTSCTAEWCSSRYDTAE